MKCPVDGETLIKTERMGIEIDYCPVCRGVWLDRGELDKIIQRTMDEEQFRQGGQGPRRPYSGAGHHHDPYAPPPGSRRSGRHHEHDYPHHDRHHGHYGGHHKGKYYKPRYKKRKSMLGELFEEIFD